MRLILSLAVLLILAPATSRAGEVLERIRKAEMLRCAAAPEQLGFAMPEGRTGYTGFDVDFCKAVAAAILGDPGKMQFFALPPAPRAAALKDGSIDLVARDAPLSLTRGLDPDTIQAGALFHTGLGFMSRTQMNILTIEGLEGGTICLRRDVETARFFAAQMLARGVKLRTMESDSFAEAMRNFFANRCDAVLGNVYDLAVARARVDNQSSYKIGLTLLTLEAFGPIVPRGDAQFADIVRWTVNALIAAEIANVSQINLREALTSRDRTVRRLLGKDGNPGELLGLPANWVEKVVAAVGNYGDMFERNLGPNTPLGLARLPNDLWFRGGVLTSPSIP